jgi:hypothetical protein
LAERGRGGSAEERHDDSVALAPHFGGNVGRESVERSQEFSQLLKSALTEDFVIEESSHKI